MRRHRISRRDHERAVQRYLNYAGGARAPGPGPLPRFDPRKGWVGGDRNTLYAFVDQATGETVVCPGGGPCGIGRATVRVARRDEAERLWSYPLNPSWRVK